MKRTGRNILYFVLGGLWLTIAAANAEEPSDIKIENLPQPVRTGQVNVTTERSLTTLSSIGAQQVLPTTNQIASLSFSWNTPVNLAVFQRQKKLWIVFDHRQAIDVKELKKTAGDLASNIVQLPHPNAAVIQMIPAEGVRYSVRKEGLLWIVDLFRNDLPKRPVKDVTIYTQQDSLQHAYMFIPTENSGNIVNVIDPDVGDIISVAPTADIGYGVNNPYHYPEFDLLNTEQGVAMAMKAPDITISRTNTGLLIRAPERGLSISKDLDNLRRKELYSKRGETLYGFDFEVSPQLLNMNFTDAVNQLKQDILAAPQNSRNQVRLELVKYYLAKGLGTNALTMLEQMLRAKLPETTSAKFHALLGIANFLVRRYPEAVKEFEYGNLPENDDAVFWRSLAQSAYQYKEENNAVLFAYLPLIREYPQEIRDRIAAIGAATALRAGDDLAAQNFIDILKSDDGRLKNRDAQIDYLSAKKTELQGYPRNAIREYTRIGEMDDLRYSSLARYDNAVLRQQIGTLPLKEAIAELERLRFAWSEKDFKWNLLNRLAQYYEKDFDYYNALKTMKESLILADPAQKETMLRKMVGLFEDIFIDNRGDSKLSAVKALALYNDFEWLGRLSPRHNEITIKLADRLVAVDLLPRAGDLLEQVLADTSKLTPLEQAKVGARMAVILLFDNKYDSALEILEETESDNLPYQIQAQRRVIKARALASTNLVDEALELLAEDTGKNAIMLKSEIYWNAGQWNNVADTIKYLIEKPKPGQELSPEQIGYILDWATALKKSGRETVLVRLRNKFKPYFDKTKYSSTFNILTNHLETDKVDLKEINNIVNDVQMYSNFTKIYNESFKEESDNK